MTIKISLLNFLGGDGNGNLCLYFENSRKEPISQMRAKEDFNRRQPFSKNKQYLKIKLMQNEKVVGVFLVKTKYW